MADSEDQNHLAALYGRIQELENLAAGDTQARVLLEDLRGCLARFLTAADEQRSAAEARYRLQTRLLDAVGQAVVATNLEGGILYWNRAAQSLFGWDAEEILGRTVQETVVPDSHTARAAEIIAHLRGGGTWVGEFLLRRRDSAVFPALITCTPIQDDAGAVTGLVGLALDVSDHKLIEERLQSSQVLFAEAQQLASLGSWSLEIATDTVAWSDELYRIFGRQPGKFIPNKVAIYECVHPEDRELVRVVIDEALADYLSHAFTYRVVHPDGNVRWLYARVAVVRGDDGAPRRMFGVAQDVTEQREVEERLKRTVTQLEEAQRLAHLGSWEWNPITDRVSWSEELHGIWGVSRSAFGGTYQEVLDLVHPEDRAALEACVEQALQSCRPYDFEHRIIRPDGAERIIHSRGTVITDSSGRPYRMFGTGQDITERKATENELNRSREELRALAGHIETAVEAERTHIAREIHDHLGQSLTSLKMDLGWLGDLLAAADPTTETPTLLHRIEGMIGLVDSTSQSVRELSSRLRPAMLDDLGLEPAIEWQVQEFQHRMGISCAFTAGTGTPPAEKLAPNQVTAVFRVLQEALTNVARHARASHVDVRLLHQPEQLTLEVTDDGIGIPGDVDGMNSLGLLGMRERARLLGGDVRITGSPAHGTTVFMFLPLRDSGLMEST